MSVVHLKVTDGISNRRVLNNFLSDNPFKKVVCYKDETLMLRSFPMNHISLNHRMRINPATYGLRIKGHQMTSKDIKGH